MVYLYDRKEKCIKIAVQEEKRIFRVAVTVAVSLSRGFGFLFRKKEKVLDFQGLF